MHSVTALLLVGSLLAIGFCFYFLPSIVANQRGVSSLGALVVVNLLFGWTLVGWLICLLWAATGATRAQDAFFQGRAAGTPDPTDPVFREAYARERARLDHLAAASRRPGGQPG